MIDYKAEAGVARITLNTPETENRFTFGLMSDYIAALETAATSGSHILVLDATGSDFTLGRDQKEVRPEISKRESLGLILRANDLLRGFPGISVALVNGRAFGFGTGISLHSTISVAAHDARFGFDEIKYGLAPLIVQLYLPHFISRRVATELVVTGREVPADEARQIGLVSRVLKPGESLAEAGERIVSDLQGNNRSALSLINAYERTIATYPEAELGWQAVERLANWIESGKPESWA